VSVIFSRPAPAFALIVQVPILVPCFFVFAVTPAKAPHGDPVPLALTWTLPTFPQDPVAWMFLFLRLVGVQPASGWFTHKLSWKVHVLPVAVWQSVLPFVSGPLLCSWNSAGHLLVCARLARGAWLTITTANTNAPTSAATTRSTTLPDVDLCMPVSPLPRWDLVECQMRCGRRYQGYTTSVNTIRRARLVTPKRSIRCHSEPYAGLMEARKDAQRGLEVRSRERGGLPSKEEEQCAAALVVRQRLLRARGGPCQGWPDDAGGQLGCPVVG